MIAFLILFLIGILLFYEFKDTEPQILKHLFDYQTILKPASAFIAIFGKYAMHKRANNSIARTLNNRVTNCINLVFGQHSMHKRALNSFA